MKNFSDIKITVGVTAFNRPYLLRQTVLSVLQQSYENFELIISNDYLAEAVTFETLGIESDSRISSLNSSIKNSDINLFDCLTNFLQLLL